MIVVREIIVGKNCRSSFCTHMIRYNRNGFNFVKWNLILYTLKKSSKSNGLFKDDPAITDTNLKKILKYKISQSGLWI